MDTFASSANVIGIRLGKSSEIVPIEICRDTNINMYDMTGRKILQLVDGLYIKNGKKFYNIPR